ncbi:uncharacterized protein [Asterias amurensis]|uniref:uncharacterized protein n=1 Tax=Asterias amurensis TaxID=7602 RepID=UPI003AB340A5
MFQESKRKEARQDKPKHQVMVTQASNPIAPSPSTTPQSQASTNQANPPPPCAFCDGTHSIHKCSKFGDKSMEEKTKFIQENSLCFGCLRKGHYSKNCKRRSTCAKCKRSHLTALHYDKPLQSKIPAKETNEKHVSAVSCVTNKGDSTTCTSMIVPVWVAATSDPAREVLTYAMLDTQSDASFILNSTAESLGIKGQPVQLKLATMTGSSTVSECSLLKEITVRGLHSSKVISVPKVYTRDFIPAERSLIPTTQTAMMWSHLEPIAGEISPMQDCEIGMLIGFNCPEALTPRETVTGQHNQPYAVKTDLWWSVVGGRSRVTTMCHRVMSKESPAVFRSILSVLERDFSDDKGAKVSQEDLQFLHILESSITQLKDGHLQMPLPFRSRPCLPINKAQPSLRLSHLKRKFERDKKYKDDYVSFVQDVIANGDAEEAQSDVKEGEVWYIPHHGVYHPKKPNKIRVVFDCSSQHRVTSLNDHLLSGPDLTNALVGVLSRFRIHQVAIFCDIERMFHQFIVRPEDRDYLRFLWWKDGNLKREPTEYRMKVHLFGATSSPGCANYGLKYLSKKYEKEFPSAAPFIRHHFYVDDGLISTETNNEAIQLIDEARELCSKGGIHLHKFISNSREVLESVPLKERAASVKEVDLNKDELPLPTTLGIQWDVENDEFFFKIETKEATFTRRGICR